METPMSAKKRAHDEVEEAQAPPAKRGRGRPRKDPNAAPKPPPGPNAPKRGRGRPPKDSDAGSAVKPQVGVSGRGRGRPKKDATAVTAPPSKSKPDPKAKGKKAGVKGAKSPDTKLSQLIGTYDITCEEVEDNWPDAAGDLTLSIHPLPRTGSALIAYFHLGMLEGTMLLAADKKTLERVQKQVAATDSAQSDKSVGVLASDGTLYFVWRGQDTGDEDQIHPGTGGGQSGTLQFNAKEMTFEGVGSFPSLRDKCSFAGEKISDDLRDKPSPWSEYSEKAYEEANQRRWG